MFGNKLLYYGGPGGIRRGLIWQNGIEAAPEWITPPLQYDRGSVDAGKLWGTIIFGGVQAVRRVTTDVDPVIATWTHDPGDCNLLYNKKLKVIKYEYFDWSTLTNTPAAIINSQDLFYAPDWQAATDYTGTVWHIIRFNPISNENLNQEFPRFTIYRYTDGSGGRIYQGSRISWRGNRWDQAGYPFNQLYQSWSTSDEYNSWRAPTTYNNMSISSIDLWGVSEPFMLLDAYNPTNSYPYRFALASVINCDNSTSQPYSAGAWTFTLKNAVFPDFAIYNLRNT